MKERLIQLLDLEQLSPSKFADLIGVQRSSISHVISGRNKPSFDFIQKTLTAFPGLNAEWLILGNGTMYAQMGRSATGNLFESVEPVRSQFPDKKLEHGNAAVDPGANQRLESGTEADLKDVRINPSIKETANTIEQERSGLQDTSPLTAKRVVQVMVFYDDDTFRSYRPSQ